MSQPSQDERRPTTILRRADQAAAAALVAVSLAIIAGYWLKEWGRQSDVIGIEPDAPPIAYLVDINAAQWSELALLPGVGEILAKRIVASRESEGYFPDHEALRRVRGIGPITLERMRPYLLPIPNVESMAGP